ncbi:hypothetical protein [Fundidesulfovibrio soli]|uniref:hypothetical protein n=1 Tax=Fundidesulfovibrio soli TaxID=2922716 RepID=UPI001FAF6A96|nr:hypothetical protein [Fundidesulfovibrio soli]
MHKRVILALVVCALFAASGCDTVKPYWKSTKKMYKEYVNVDPTIDLTDLGTSDPTVLKFAELFTPVDAQLEYLLRALSAQDAPPDSEWVQNVMTSFPWLTGLAELSPTGTLVRRQPSFSIKKVDFAPLVEFEKLYKERKMAAAVSVTELGAEIMIAKPLYVENDFVGILVAHFDASSLAKQSPEPGKLLIMSPGETLWGGDDPGAGQAMAQLKWKNILKSNVTGQDTVGGRKFQWQARAVAQTYLIYAIETVKEQPKQPKAAPQPQPAAEPAPAQAPAQVPAQ